MPLTRRQMDLLDELIHGLGYDGTSSGVEPYRWKAWVSALTCREIHIKGLADRHQARLVLKGVKRGLSDYYRRRWGDYVPGVFRNENPESYALFCQQRCWAAGIAWLCYALDILYWEE